MGKVIETTDANFANDIATGVSIVDFWAIWCGPCQVMIPRLDELATKMGDKAKIMKMNVDENGQVPQTFGIRSIPTMIIFKDGKAVEQLVGIQSVDLLASKLESHI
ncbi:thioredoxin [Candidatus Gracilibacteria bacterium]|nr:thioredoxin [Candidatus Gracilibacteria bacterium]